MEFSRKFLRVTALVLMVLMIMPSMPTFAATFKDVPSTHWAYSYIEEMGKLGFINGYNDGTFKPKGTLTYLETMQLLSKLLNMTDSEVKASKDKYSGLVAELKVPTWAQEAVMKCLYRGVITESDLRKAASLDMIRVGTNKRVGRLDISIYMAKAMELEDEANSKPFVSLTFKDLLSIKSEYHKLLYVLIEAGVLNANGTGNGYFEPSSPLLREQMAKMMSAAYNYLQKGPQTPGTPQTPSGDTELIVGTISAINKLGSNTFITVKAKSGSEAAYLIDTSTSVRLDGKLTTVTSLFEGQTVEVTIKKGTSNAINVEAETLETKITGTIKSVSPVTNKITVEYEENKTTKTAELIVVNNADITLDGTDARLIDLNKGDKVVLEIENNNVVEIEATAMSGEIEGVIVDLESEVVSRETIYYITVEKTKGSKVEYELDEDVTIRRDGRRAKFEDLRPGDEVVLELEYGLVVEVDAEVVERKIKGVISAISTRLNSGTEITIRNKETDKEESYSLAKDAKIEVDEKTGNITNLNVGYYVVAIIGSDEILDLEADTRGAESMIRGTITDVNKRRSEVDLEVISSDLSQYRYGDDITIEITDDTYIAGNYDIDDLRKNWELLVFGYFDGYKLIVTEINIR
ncbi:S-layer homology domain-containing protein [Tissierella sp. Yu-01]|uniref:S-layer homology domain-containing protein n=1 Tax=Tissierella sp. Yu-01 TaxID=3035694 RepID=UPI00240E64E6|nr:S-layer homology domain-containing protein [Tissierella sp. Yu-01]WFA08670.1 S-layer homology domain-containing protein [Tissierella sp. Yu-01]